MTQLAAVVLGTVPAEGDGIGTGLMYLAVGLVMAILLGPLAFLIGRDANRRGRNGWAWGLLFLWQPVIVGVAYLINRRHRRPPVASTS